MHTSEAFQNAGVGFTFLLNLCIVVILLSSFFICCQPHMTLFNPQKKRKLLDETLSLDEQQEEEEESEEITRGTYFTNRLGAGDDNDEDEDADQRSQDDTSEIASASVSCFSHPIRFISHKLGFLNRVLYALISPSARKSDLNKLCTKYGRDIASYIYFQQQLIYTMVVCSMVGVSVLIPLHMTGKLREDPNGSQPINPNFNMTMSDRLLSTTVVMRIAQPNLMFIHVALTALFLLAFGFFMIHQFVRSKIISKLNYMGSDEHMIYETSTHDSSIIKNASDKARPFRNRQNMVGMVTDNWPRQQSDRHHHDHSNIYLYSPYSVVVKGVPKEMSFHNFRDIIYTATSQIDQRLTNRIAKVSMIPNLTQRVKKQKKLEQLYTKLRQANFQREHSKNSFPKVTLFCQSVDDQFHLVKRVEAHQYYAKKIVQLENELHQWDNSFLSHIDIQHGKQGGGTYGSIGSSSRRKTDGAKSRSRKASQVVNPNMPKCSGIGFVVFTSRTAREKFVERYSRSGIVISSKNKYSTSSSSRRAEKAPLLEYAVQYEQSYAKRLLAKCDVFGFLSLRVSRVHFEPEDVDWRTVFQWSNMSGIGRFFRNILTYIGLLFIFVFVSTPIAASGGIQRLLEIRFIQLPISWIRTISGTWGEFFFQYLPSLLLLLASVTLPRIIVRLTMLVHRNTHSATQRKIFRRVYIYFLLSILILPSLLLVSVEGAVHFFNRKMTISKLFAYMFVPSSGGFFINFVLQKALLQNTLDLISFGTMISYIWKTRFSRGIWRYTPFSRVLNPKEKLKIAEVSEIELELEYAFLHLVMAITLTFSIFSPVILPCCLLYLLYKYIVDRYNIICIYGHRRSLALRGAVNGLRSDFVAHHKMASQQVLVTLGSMSTFTVLQAIFFGTKLVGNRSYIYHTVILMIVAAICVISMPFAKLILKQERKRVIKMSNNRLSSIIISSSSGSIRKGKIIDKVLSPSEFKSCYEPSASFSYLPKIENVYQQQQPLSHNLIDT